MEFTLLLFKKVFCQQIWNRLKIPWFIFNQDDATTKNFLGVSGWFVGLGEATGNGY